MLPSYLCYVYQEYKYLKQTIEQEWKRHKEWEIDGESAPSLLKKLKVIEKSLTTAADDK